MSIPQEKVYKGTRMGWPSFGLIHALLLQMLSFGGQKTLKIHPWMDAT